MGTVERIQAVADKVAKSYRSGNQLVVAVSAMSGETNRLIGLAKEIDDQPSLREMDVLVSTGEQVTIALLCMALAKVGIEARSYTGSQVRILTDSSHGKARIQAIDSHLIEAECGQEVWTFHDQYAQRLLRQVASPFSAVLSRPYK